MENERMKICFFTTDFPPSIGGISEFSRSIAYHTAESPSVEQVAAIALQNREPGVEHPSDKLTVIREGRQSFVRMVWSVLRYAYRFRSYDAFHATSVFPIGFLTVLIGKYVFGKPVFVTFYGTDVLSTKGSAKTKWAKRWTVAHATRSLGFSNSTKRRAAEHLKLPEEKFARVYYPLPDEFSRGNPEKVSALKKEFGIQDTDFIVLFVGHLVRRKGPEDLIHALAKVPDPRVKLLFVGKGPMGQELKLLAKSYKLEARVIFAGEHIAVPFFDLARAFAMPSFFDRADGDIEGLGIVFLEAEQRGIPVIGTNSGGVPEAIDADKSGFVVPERSVDSIAEKISLLANDSNLCERMGEAGKRFVKDRFNAKKSVEEHLALYKNRS
ncbi:MAG: glycosyltransferase family 4 protein [Parcubacteria group bacterium]|nr:glycosyltransferase family 4 protein [Parcubacteria group bacterium]